MRVEFKKVVKYILAAIGALIVLYILFIVIVGVIFQETGRSVSSRRLADARMIASGLEMYKDEYKEYPTSLDKLVPTYLGVVPAARTERKPKICAGDLNQYKYTMLSKTDFTLTFCLEEMVGNFPPGIHTFTPTGVK